MLIFLGVFYFFDEIGLDPVSAPGRVTNIVNAGDARLFFTIQSGRILIHENGQVLSTPFLDIENLVDDQFLERGLIGLAFHPQYGQTGFFFIAYSDNQGDTVIARYRVSTANPNLADPNSQDILITLLQPDPRHNGGQLQFGPDGYLYIGSGDGNAPGDPECNAQNLDTWLGKILRVDVNQNVQTPPFYANPPDNPFGASPIWAMGLRNPWRFSFDSLQGDLFITDVGQENWEEINMQPAMDAGGHNYGWNVREGMHCYGAMHCPLNPPCSDPNFTEPVLEYGHTASRCAITGGYVYRGCAIPYLEGMYIFSDYCSNSIWAAWQTSPGVWTEREIFSAGAPGATTFGEDVEGELYLANAISGNVLRLVPLSAELFAFHLARWATFQATRCDQGWVTVLDLIALIPQ